MTNGPQVGQSVTSCSPCVMLGLTPALLAQFKSVDTVTAPATTPNFPVSNAPGSSLGGIDLTFTVSAPGQTSVTGTGYALLDTGTNAYYLYVSNPSTFSAFGSSDGLGGYNLNPGTSLTVAGTTSGATPSAITVFNESLYSVDVQRGNFDSIYGLGFFLQNSVMYNLAGQVVGYTPNFVTDTNIVPNTAAPLVIDSSSVPLGLAGVISGPGGIFVNSGGSATLSGTNTYIGATAINGGYLALVGPGSISSSSGVGITASGIFDISGVTNGATITSLSGDSSGFVSLGAQTLTLSAANGTFAGTIYGSGGLAVSAGILGLTGNNTYSGGTTLTDGTIIVGRSSVGLPGAITSSPLGTGTLAMAAGTTLSFTNGSYTIVNAITLSGDPTIMTSLGLLRPCRA
jgi:autotransporter-associated beta strand protein